VTGVAAVARVAAWVGLAAAAAGRRSARRSGRPRGSRGAVAIEFVVLIPVVLLVATMVLQVGVTGWSASQTERAARDAARAVSLDRDPVTAANRSLPGILHVDAGDVSRAGERVEVRVSVPKVSVLPKRTVTRSVTIPRTAP
jgi:uncharacterized protein (UPF0333 family)